MTFSRSARRTSSSETFGCPSGWPAMETVFNPCFSSTPVARTSATMEYGPVAVV
jgi:hypothetical protein